MLTPKEYWDIVYKSFFKASTLSQEVKTWNKAKKHNTVIQIGFYNYLFFIIFFITSLLIKLLLTDFLFNEKILIIPHIQDLFVIAVLGLMLIVSGVIGGVAVGISLGFSAGITIGIAVKITFGPAIGVTIGTIIGVMAALSAGVVRGIVREITRGTIKGVVRGIAGGLAGGVVIGIPFGVLYGLVYGISFCLLYIFFLGRLFYYPFYIFSRYKKINVRRLPLHFDENIDLPILLLSAILVKQARYDQENTVETTLKFIRERPVHRKSAQKALMLIALEVMENFQNIRDISALNKRLDFLPDSPGMLPDDFNRGYGDLLNVAKDLRVVVSMYNPSDQILQLRKVLDALKTYQSRIDASRNRNEIRFTEVFQRWSVICREEHDRLESLTCKPLPNPFIPGIPLSRENQEIFVGRRDIIAHIQSETLCVGGAGALLFLGGRRTGKTSTLFNMHPYLSSVIKPVYIDFHNSLVNTGLADFCTYLFEHSCEVLGKVMNDSPEVTDTASLTRFFMKLDKELANTGEYLLLCFDEYERIDDKIADGQFMMLPHVFRSWIQTFKNIICLFVGLYPPLELATKTPVNWTDYLINCRVIPISFLELDAAMQLVTRPVPSYDLLYEPNILARELVIRHGCHPYLIQMTMFELTQHLNKKGSKTAYGEDIDHAVTIMFERASMFLVNQWEDLEQKERDFLMQLAHDKKIPSPPSTIIKSLKRKNIITSTDTTYKFCVPVFKEWIVYYF